MPRAQAQAVVPSQRRRGKKTNRAADNHLFGRHRPAGLNLTNDEELHSLLTDIETWKSNLPADLQFRGSETPRNAGE